MTTTKRKLVINFGDKPKSTKPVNYTGKDEVIREKRLAKLTGSKNEWYLN